MKKIRRVAYAMTAVFAACLFTGCDDNASPYFTLKTTPEHGSSVFFDTKETKQIEVEASQITDIDVSKLLIGVHFTDKDGLSLEEETGWSYSVVKGAATSNSVKWTVSVTSPDKMSDVHIRIKVYAEGLQGGFSLLHLFSEKKEIALPKSKELYPLQNVEIPFTVTGTTAADLVPSVTVSQGWTASVKSFNKENRDGVISVTAPNKAATGTLSVTVTGTDVDLSATSSLQCSVPADMLTLTTDPSNGSTVKLKAGGTGTVIVNGTCSAGDIMHYEISLGAALGSTASGWTYKVDSWSNNTGKYSGKISITAPAEASEDNITVTASASDIEGITPKSSTLTLKTLVPKIIMAGQFTFDIPQEPKTGEIKFTLKDLVVKDIEDIVVTVSVDHDFIWTDAKLTSLVLNANGDYDGVITVGIPNAPYHSTLTVEVKVGDIDLSAQSELISVFPKPTT